MAEKPPYTDGRQYVHARTSEPDDIPRTLLPGELGANTVHGTAHIMRDNGSISTLPVAEGFNSIRTLSQSQYDALVAATATISTVLYVVTPDPA
jgi:hypothetical protein